MKMYLKLSRFIEILYLVAVVCIAFRGQTIAIKFTSYAALSIIFLVVVSQLIAKIKINFDMLPLQLYFIWVLCSYYWNADVSTFNGYKMKIVGFLMATIFVFDKFFWEYFLKIAKIIGYILLASIFLEVVSPNLFIKCFGFVIFKEQAALSNAYSGVYTGLAGGNQQAAIILCVGLAVILAEVIVRNKISKKDVCKVLLFSIGIYLVGKRTLLAVAFLLVLVAVIKVCDKKTRELFIIISALVALIGFTVIKANILQLDVSNSFWAGEGGDMLSGREHFWLQCISMFQRSKIKGFGYLSFNKMLFLETGYLFKGQPWTYQAHSVYFQTLAELGLVGIVLLIFQFLFAFIKFVQIEISKEKEEQDIKVQYVCFGILLMIVIYCSTGNCFYVEEETMLYVIAYCGLIYTNKRIKGIGKENVK